MYNEHDAQSVHEWTDFNGQLNDGELVTVRIIGRATKSDGSQFFYGQVKDGDAIGNDVFKPEAHTFTLDLDVNGQPLMIETTENEPVNENDETVGGAN